MKNLIAAWHKSIFTRLLLIFLIILVPLYFGGIAIYSWGTSAVQEEISRSISSQGAAWMDGFAQEVERIRLLEYECLTDPDLDSLSVRAEAMSDMQRTEAVNRLLDRLAAIQSSSRYIASASIYLPAIGRELLSRGSTTEMSPEEFTRLAAEAGSKYPILFDGNDARLTAAYPIQDLKGGRTARYLIVVELSLAEMRNSIAGMDIDGRGAVLTGGGGLVLASGLEGGEAAQMTAAADRAGPGGGTAAVRYGGGSYLVSRAGSESLGMTLYRFAPESEIMAPLNRYRLLFLFFTMAAVGVIVMFTIASRGLIDQAYRQKILAQRAELKQLQSQINPHFLYNSFFLLQNMVDRGDNDGASAFARQLGSYFQFVTRNASDEVALDREVAHARAYAEIQSRRFRGRIAVEFGDLPKHFEGLVVPRLILQPVIENAFEHGLENKPAGGTLRVFFAETEGFLIACVEDNGGMTADGAALLSAQLEGGGATESTALINIHRRLRLKFGPRAGMRFSAGEAGGLRAELWIPLDGGGDGSVQAAHRR